MFINVFYKQRIIFQSQFKEFFDESIIDKMPAFLKILLKQFILGHKFCWQLQFIIQPYIKRENFSIRFKYVQVILQTLCHFCNDSLKSKLKKALTAGNTNNPLPSKMYPAKKFVKTSFVLMFDNSC